MAGESLKGAPDRDYGKFIEREYNQEARSNALAGKARAQQSRQDDSKVAKYLHDIDVGDKVHRWYADDARNNMAGLMSDIEAAKEKYGEYNYMNHLQEPIAKRLSVAKDLIRKSAPLKAEEKFYESHGDQYTEPQKQMLQAMQIGTKEDAKKINDPMGTVNMNDQGEVNFAKRLPTKFDIKKRAADFLDGLAKSNGSQIVSNVELPGTNGKRAIETGTFLPETPEDARAAEDKMFKETGQKVTFTDKRTALTEQFKGDPAIQAWYGEANRDKYTKDAPLDFKDPKSNWKDKMAEDYFNDHKGFGGQSFKRSVVTPVQPKEKLGKTAGGGFQSEAFSIEPSQSEVGGKGFGNTKYVITPRGDKKEAIKDIKASYAIDASGKKLSDKDFGGVVQGQITGVVPMINPNTKQAEFYVEVTQPEFKASSKSEQTYDQKSGKTTTTNTPQVAGADVIYIPYNDATGNAKGTIKGMTKPKKGIAEGWELTKEDYQNLDTINESITGKSKSTHKAAPVVKKNKEELRSSMKNIF